MQHCMTSCDVVWCNMTSHYITLQEEPDTLEGDEDESPIATSGLMGESLLINYLENSCKVCSKYNEELLI